MQCECDRFDRLLHVGILDEPVLYLSNHIEIWNFILRHLPSDVPLERQGTPCLQTLKLFVEGGGCQPEELSEVIRGGAELKVDPRAVTAPVADRAPQVEGQATDGEGSVIQSEKLALHIDRRLLLKLQRETGYPSRLLRPEGERGQVCIDGALDQIGKPEADIRIQPLKVSLHAAAGIAVVDGSIADDKLRDLKCVAGLLLLLQLRLRIVSHERVVVGGAVFIDPEPESRRVELQPGDGDLTPDQRKEPYRCDQSLKGDGWFPIRGPVLTAAAAPATICFFSLFTAFSLSITLFTTAVFV